MTKNIIRGLAAVGALSVGAAHAALDAGIGTAVTSAGTDGATLVGLLAAAGAAVYLIAKLLRKFGILL